jgi:hypothetical protein
MNCEEAAEFVSALCDGGRIPRTAAEHVGTCEVCATRLREYVEMGAELRRVASLESAAQIADVDWSGAGNKIGWRWKEAPMMRIPKLAFGVMLIAIVALSGRLALVGARAGSANGRFLELKYKLPTTRTADICVMKADGSQKGNLCNFVYHAREGLFLMNTRVIANSGDHAELGIRTKYIPGAGETEVNYSEALFKDVPEEVLSLEPGQTQGLQVVGLGTVEVQGDYLDHLPPLVYRPQETLDPNPKEFRIVAPVLVRDNQVISNADGSSIDTGSRDATLMLYVPGEGRYLVSIVPFEGAVEGNVHLGQITFSLQGHDYLLLTSVPITISEHVWVKHEPDFKASEHMIRPSESRDDQPMFLVRSLRKLEQNRIEH